MDVDHHPVVRHLINAVPEDAGIPKAILVVGIDDQLAVVLVFLLDQLAAAEERPDALAFGFLHRLSKLLVGELHIAMEIDVPDLDPFAWFDENIQQHGIVDRRVHHGLNIGRGIEVALVAVVPLDLVDRIGLQVLSDDQPAGQVDLFADVVPLGFFDPEYSILGELGQFLQADLKKDGVADLTCDRQRNIVEELLSPQFADRTLDLLTGKGDLFTHLEAAEQDNDRVVEIAAPLNLDASDLVLDAGYDVNGLSPHKGRPQKGDQTEDQYVLAHLTSLP